MKKILIITTVILGVVFTFNSCEKNDFEPKLKATATVNPAMTNPTNDMELTLLLADSVNPVVFDWSAATYTISEGTLSNPVYSLSIVQADSSWDMAKELINTTGLTYENIVYDFNQLMLDLGVVPEVPTSMKVKVASIISTVGVTAVDSEEINFSLTTFEPPVPPPVGKSLYLIGDATDIGWDNNNISLPFIYNEEADVYEIIANLSGTGFLKAFEVQGQWAPQWGTDDDGTSETGILVYRPTEDEPDPVAIPSPEAGVYKITFDLTNLVYTIEPFEETMHIIGDATEAGWDNTIAIPMVNVGLGKFELVANLNTTGTEGFKFLVDQGAWAPMYGTVEGAAFESGVLVYRETEAVPDPKAIPPPPSTGSYLIEMDIIELTYTVTPQ